MSLRCGYCHTDFKRNENKLKCSGLCERDYHPRCLSVSDEVLNKIGDNNHITWRCSNCIRIGANQVFTELALIKQMVKSIIPNDLVEEVKSLKTMLNKCVEKIEMQEKIIDKLSNKTEEIIHQALEEKPSTYAEKLKMGKSEPVVVIKPKNGDQRSSKTKEEIKEKLNPVQLSVKSMRNVTKGGILLECKNNEAVEKVKEEVREVLGENYEVKVPVKRKPRIKITGLSEERSEEELVENMILQNDYLDENASIKILHRTQRRGKYNLFSVIAEVDGKSYMSLIKNQKINVGWDRCYVSEVLSIMRCYKCSGYQHKARDCKNPVACPKCARNHLLDQCTNNTKECINCKMASRKLNIKIDCNHEAWDRSCPVYSRKVNTERNKINYEK